MTQPPGIHRPLTSWAREKNALGEKLNSQVLQTLLIFKPSLECPQETTIGRTSTFKQIVREGLSLIAFLIVEFPIFTVGPILCSKFTDLLS